MRMIDADALLSKLVLDPPMNWNDSDAEIQAVSDWEEFVDMIHAEPTIKECSTEEVRDGLTYIDLLSALHTSVCSDSCMPRECRDAAIKRIVELEILLEKYSG